MAKEIIIGLRSGCVSIDSSPEGQNILLHDYDCEGQDPADLHVDGETGGWYHKIRLYSDGSELVIKPAKEKSAQAQLDAEAQAGVHQ